MSLRASHLNSTIGKGHEQHPSAKQTRLVIQLMRSIGSASGTSIERLSAQQIAQTLLQAV